MNSKNNHYQSDNLDSNHPYPIFRLRDLIKPSLSLWVLSWTLGLMTALSVIGLLMVSGWFLTTTALAGMFAVSGSIIFNYALPSAIIRTLAIIRTVGRYGELMVSHHAIFSLLKELRVRFFHHLAIKPLNSQHASLQSIQQMHRLVRDINILNEFNLRVIMPWSLAIIIMGSLISAIIIFLPIFPSYWQGLLVVAMVLCLILPAFISYRGIYHSRAVADLSEKRREALLAPLTIVTQLLMWQQWDKQTKHFIDYDEKLHRLDWQAHRHKSHALLVMQWLLYGVILLLLIGAMLFSTLNELSNIAILLAFIFAIFSLQELILPLAQHYLAFGNATASKDRLNELLNQSNDLSKVQNKADLNRTEMALNPIMSLPEHSLTVQLDHVCAKMPTAIVGANNVTATIRTGVPTIISGVSGCGKSTLLQTLANELLPQSGKILLNGQPWQSYDWQDQLGYLGQQIDIFDQTLADNLRLGKSDASDEELMIALNKVSLTDWVNAQPQGLNTHLGEYGMAISGGQARRIALARLLLKPRKVVLLDEPFAGLDQKSHEKVWQSVKAHQKNAILIVVSHHDTGYNVDEIDRLQL